MDHPVFLGKREGGDKREGGARLEGERWVLPVMYWHVKVQKQSIRSGGWVGGSVRKYSHFVAPSGKLRLARFSAELEIFQMGPSVEIITKVNKIIIFC